MTVPAVVSPEAPGSTDGDARDAEVHDLELGRLGQDQHVLRLDVAVHDARLRGRRRARGTSAWRSTGRRRVGSAPRLADQVLEGDALDVLHRDVGDAARLAEVVGAQHVPVRDAARELELLLEALEERRVGGERLRAAAASAPPPRRAGGRGRGRRRPCRPCRACPGSRSGPRTPARGRATRRLGAGGRRAAGSVPRSSRWPPRTSTPPADVAGRRGRRRRALAASPSCPRAGSRSSGPSRAGRRAGR